jgi:PPOX class probable F420-dependent enzyme
MTQSSTTPFGKGVKQRDVIRMTPEEIQAFLREQRTMSCATINHDGTIHVIAMWYGFLDGCPALETKTKSQKVQNLRRDPRISCLVEDGDVYEQLRGVEIVGHAEIIDDPEQMFELGKSVVERYMSNGQPYTDDLRPAVEAMLHKRVVVKIHADRYVSWDHRKLGGGG